MWIPKNACYANYTPHSLYDRVLDLNLDNVVISLSRTEQPLLSLSGCSYVRTLRDMNRSNPFVATASDDGIPEIW